MIGLPNAIRSLAYCVARSRSRPARCRPPARAAPRRVRSSVASATARPRPSSPIRFSAGTRTSSNDRRAGRRALDAELVLELAGTEKPVAVLLDDERASMRRVLAVGDREHDVEVGDRRVGDPVLGAVDDPLVAVADGGRAHRRRVGARLGLGQREGRRPLAGRALAAASVCFCSSVPNSWIGSVPSSWTIRISALDAHALAISSTAICSISVPVPVPPYSSSNGSAEDVVLGEQPCGRPTGTRRSASISAARGRDPLLRDLADRVAEVEVLLRQA